MSDLRRAFECDEAQLCAWARELGAQLRGGDVILLDGQMGAGKTTFTRALAEGLKVARPERVCSPTYTVCMIHPGSAEGEGLDLVHIDLFRLGEQHGAVGSAAFEALGLEHDELPGPGGVLVVEWAELWAEAPAGHLSITLERSLDSEHTRRIEISSQALRWAFAFPAKSKK